MQAHPLSSTAARSSIDVRRFPALANSFARASPIPEISNLEPLEVMPQSLVAESAHGLAHDVGNLLLAFELYTGLLDAPGVLQPQHRHYARALQVLSRRSAAMVERLLCSVSEVEAQSHALPAVATRATAQPLDWPAAVLRGMAPLLEGLAAPAATLSMALESDLPPLPLGRDGLERILANMVRNAAEAIAAAPYRNSAQGHIRVSLSSDRTQLLLQVEDDGPGMPPSVAAAFLHPVPRVAGARRGLGHRIVHELVTQSGGRLSLRGGGVGTTICIAWPLASTLSRTSRRSLQGAFSPC